MTDTDRRELGEQMQQRGHRDVVGQVCDHCGRRFGQVGRMNREDVTVQHREPVDLAVGVIGDRLRQLAREHRIDLDGGHLRTAIQQCQRQRAQTGTHLEHVIVTVDAGRRHDATNCVRIVNEVLAKRLPRAKVQFLRQMPYLGPPEQSNRQDVPTLPLHTGHAPNLDAPE